MLRWLRKLFVRKSGAVVKLKPVVRLTARVYREKTDTWEELPVRMVSE